MTSVRPLVARLLMLSVVAAPCVARANDVQTSSVVPNVSALRRAASVSVALVPGALVHGLGHVALGEGEAGLRLLVAEGVGLGLFLLGGLTIVFTGANRYLVGPAAASGIAGLGLFTTTWLADIFGTAVPNSVRGVATRQEPMLTATLHYTRISDPRFALGHTLGASIDAWTGSVRWSPSVRFGVGDRRNRAALAIAWRPYGLVPGPKREFGSFLELRGDSSFEHFGNDRFRIANGALALAGRYDLASFESALGGIFVDGEVGAGLQWISYLDAPDAPDFESVLLTRFAFGAYLPFAEWGSEASIYYDHRHDSDTGGFLMSGLGSGAAGAFGVDVRIFPFSDVGFRLRGEVGSAYLLDIGLVARFGSLQ